MSDNVPIRSADVEAVIFDYGDVLCHPPTPAEKARLAGFFGIGVDVLQPLWDKNRGAYDRGDLTAEKYWSMLAADAGNSIAPAQLEEICRLDVEMWSHVNSSMVDWARRLDSSGVKIAVLSNMHADMATYAREHFAWLASFDWVTFSAEVRLIKPDPAIYEHTLRGLGVAASETLFLDDRAVNVRAARQLGIQAIRFRSMERLRGDLQAAGFGILPGDF